MEKKFKAFFVDEKDREQYIEARRHGEYGTSPEDHV
jgi:hypothetical protein